MSSSACTGPKRGPVRAKTAENACKGPKDGPVRALSFGEHTMPLFCGCAEEFVNLFESTICFLRLTEAF